MSAAAGADANPFAGLMQGAAAAGSGSAAAAGGATTTSTSGGGGDQPSTQPLPNPWAPQGGDAAGELQQTECLPTCLACCAISSVLQS